MNNLLRFIFSFPASGRLAVLLAALPLVGWAASPSAEVRLLTLDECVHTALLNNRDLQAEQLNPAVARATLGSAYGYYDPIFLGDTRRETDVETGGFDPANFSADAVYEAESIIANASITGFLPSGMSYSLYGNYANATGTRNSLDFDSYKLFAGVTVRQPLLKNLWTDAGRYTIKINKRVVKFSELGVQFIAMDVINRVEQAYYELAYAVEADRIQRQLILTRTNMLSATRRRVENGLATQPEEQLAQAQLALAQTAWTANHMSVSLAENELRTQMGDSFTNQPATSWRPGEHLLLLRWDSDLGESWRKGVKARPDLAQFRVEVERAKDGVRYRHNQLFPSLDVTAGYGRRGSSSVQDVPPFTPEASLAEAAGQIRRGDAPRDMIGVILTVPLTMQAERSNYKASKHLRAQAEIRLKQKEELVLREISDAYHMAQTAYDRAVTSREAVRHSRAALEAEEKRLAGGTSTIFFVLQLQNDLVASELLEARARADYNKALAQWRYAEGSSIEQRNVNLEIR
jgi:outer membrane protein